MKKQLVAAVVVLAFICCAAAQNQTAPTEKPMHATGSFDVKISPPSPADPASGASRFSGEKQYHGDLEAGGRADMLASGDPKTGNAGIVGIEKVSGKLNGRTGSFVLQHSGRMTGGAQEYSVTVVPGSGTDELSGIAGNMKIRIEPGGKHFYDFDYTLPKP
jgi:hypothetical protein